MEIDENLDAIDLNLRYFDESFDLNLSKNNIDLYPVFRCFYNARKINQFAVELGQNITAFADINYIPTKISNANLKIANATNKIFGIIMPVHANIRTQITILIHYHAENKCLSLTNQPNRDCKLIAIATILYRIWFATVDMILQIIKHLRLLLGLLTWDGNELYVDLYQRHCKLPKITAKNG
eukprot:Mrub_09735.p1 GENE.Mrub_09735~~Mrub_09735.p1  ORF type:complete len:209 (+),score=3.63 Mrub_09735:83-628(+)